jgi:hypothetical protein
MTDKLVRRPDDFDRYLKRLAGASDDPPTLDGVSPAHGKPSDQVTVSGTNLEYVSVYFGPFEAPVRDRTDDRVVVEVPDPATAPRVLDDLTFGRTADPTSGERRPSEPDAARAFSTVVVGPGGTATLPESFEILWDAEPVADEPTADDWRTFSAPLSDRRLRPAGTDYRYLGLAVRGADQSMSGGLTSSDAVSRVESRAKGASTHLTEASLGAFSFTTDVHSALVALPKPQASYMADDRPRRVLGRGATYPVTFDTDATLTLSSDTFSVTVTFASGTYTLTEVTTLVNDAVAAASPNPSEPPLEAGAEGGQLELATTERGADADLSVDGGTATSALGLDSPTTTAGVDSNREPVLAAADALGVVFEGMSRAAAASFVGQYDGVFVVHYDDTSCVDDEHPRAHATFGQEVFEIPAPDPDDPITVRLGVVQAHKCDDDETFAHEVGHNIQFPDLYDEPGPPEQVGVELRDWDLMANSDSLHPAAWIKAWKSGHFVEDGTSVEGTPWVTEVRDVYRPTAGDRETLDVLLFPASLPFPSDNPYAELYPGTDLVQGLRFHFRPRGAPDRGSWTVYAEAREGDLVWSTLGADALNDSSIPEEGVIVTDAVNYGGAELDVPVYRAHSTLLSEGALRFEPITEGDTEAEKQAKREKRTFSYPFPDGTRLELTLQEVYTGDPQYPNTFPDPNAYKLHVDWGPDADADPSVRYDLRIRPWDGPPWESPDIWLDTAFENEWDEYVNSDSDANPDVPGSPVGNGDRAKVDEPARLYARVWNDGQDAATDVTVRFSVVYPPGAGEGVPVGENTIGRIEPGSFGLAQVVWTPRDTHEEHVCVRASIVDVPNDYNTTNNVAQENVTDWYLERGSPYAPVESTVSVVNPLSETATIRLSVDGLRHGYHVALPDDSITLAPDEQVDLPMRLWADDWVPTDQTLLDDGDAPPVVSVTFSFPYGCSWVPFGGISGVAHTVDRIEPEVTFTTDDTVGEGTATVELAPGSDVVVDAPVTVRLHAADADDGQAPIRVVRTETDEEGVARATVVLPRDCNEDDEYELRVFVAPTPRSGPAEATRRVTFHGDDPTQKRR